MKSITTASISLIPALFLAMIMIAGCSFDTKSKSEDNWQSVYSEAKILEFAGEDDSAEEKLKLALKSIPENEKKDFYETDLNLRLAKILVRKGMIDEAKPLITRVLSYHGNTAVDIKEQSEILVLIDDLSDLYLHKADRSKASYPYCLTTSLKLLEVSKSGLTRKPIKIYSLLSSYYIEKKEIEKGMRMFETALTILGNERNNINDDIESLLNVYVALKEINLDKQAQDVMRRLTKLFKGDDIENTIPYYMYGKLGTIYSEQNNSGMARNCFEKAIKLAKNETDIDPTVISEFYIRLAAVYERLNEHAKVDAAYLAAIKVQKEKRGGSGLRSLGKRYDAYSKYLERRKDYVKADQFKKEAIQVKSRYFDTLGRKRSRHYND